MKYGFKGGLTVNGADVDRTMKVEWLGGEYYSFSIEGRMVVVPKTVAIDVAKWILADVEYRNA